MFSVQISAERVTLTLPAVFHGEQGALLIEEMLGHLRAGHRSFTLDLAPVDSIDSMGVGVMVQVAKTVADWGGTLAIAGPSPEVCQILRLTGLSNAFVVVPG